MSGRCEKPTRQKLATRENRLYTPVSNREAGGLGRRSMGTVFFGKPSGEVAEWLIVPVSKTGMSRKGIEGSNPSLSAE